jgi:hypothetical protein
MSCDDQLGLRRPQFCEAVKGTERTALSTKDDISEMDSEESSDSLVSHLPIDRGMQQQKKVLMCQQAVPEPLISTPDKSRALRPPDGKFGEKPTPRRREPSRIAVQKDSDNAGEHQRTARVPDGPLASRTKKQAVRQAEPDPPKTSISSALKMTGLGAQQEDDGLEALKSPSTQEMAPLQLFHATSTTSSLVAPLTANGNLLLNGLTCNEELCAPAVDRARCIEGLRKQKGHAGVGRRHVPAPSKTASPNKQHDANAALEAVKQDMPEGSNLLNIDGRGMCYLQALRTLAQNPLTDSASSSALSCIQDFRAAVCSVDDAVTRTSVGKRGNLFKLPLKKEERPKDVHFITESGLWRAQIRIQGQTCYIGEFKTASEALDAYRTAQQIAGEAATPFESSCAARPGIAETQTAVQGEKSQALACRKIKQTASSADDEKENCAEAGPKMKTPDSSTLITRCPFPAECTRLRAFPKQRPQTPPGCRQLETLLRCVAAK